MSISSTEGETDAQHQDTKLKGEKTVAVENKQDTNLSTEKVEKDSDLPVQKEEGKLAIAGVRPIGSSDLQIAGTVKISGIRPIGISTLAVADTVNIMGIRPIAAQTFEVVDTINLSGIRPIAASTLVIANNYSSFGNRPTASNLIDDSPVLMGFLD
ncbi:hypothetical protein [Anabaenopsis elenkinii]|jgi:hypothetical protein|uniref:Uncharacterized protein n=1 Tax=Anabaenopsis elenkinii CCIBt3563 TaxID=2779889 RepID=A0A7U3NMB8_9CYAN|nr:hypothetical protein [Anabaenopsis elenkinii]QOV21974.1 hypothetical protein IM676_14855 [Anabaenopsis elenkinii CCIBt3563]